MLNFSDSQFAVIVAALLVILSAGAGYTFRAIQTSGPQSCAFKTIDSVGVRHEWIVPCGVSE